MCIPGRSWCLTQQGYEVAESAYPVILDDLDRDVLTIIARAPSRIVAVAKQTGTCNLTVRRRIDLLTQSGLAQADARNRFSVTSAGLAALGDIDVKRPAPWVRIEAISAALSRDVRERGPDDRPTWLRSQHAAEAGAKGAAGFAALRRREGFIDTMGEFDRLRMAG